MNPIAKRTDLITQERVQMSIRARFNPIPSLTPQLLSSYLEAFRLGFFRNIALTWDAMERRDYTLQAVAAKRRKSVARSGWEILTVNDSPAAQQQKRVLEYFYNNLTATNALEENETGGTALLIRQMMDSVGKRYAVHEIIWQPQPSAKTVGENNADFAPSLTATFRFCPLWWFEGTQGRLRFVGAEFGQLVGGVQSTSEFYEESMTVAPGFNDGNWHSAVFTLDESGSSVLIHLYVDGAESGNFEGNSAIPPRTFSNATDPNGGGAINVRLGGNYDLAAQGSPFGLFPGSLCDVRLFNRVLSATEISEYDAGTL